MPERRPNGVLITRPAEGAERTARAVERMGLVPIIAPVLAIAPLPARLPPAASVQAVLVTSGNALAALGTAFHGRKLLAVGDATAARARAAGFADVASAAGDAAALAEVVRGCCTPGAGALLLPTARGEGQWLARRLRAAGFTVLRRAVYAALPHGSLSAAARTALERKAVGAALFFSAATARSFTNLLLAAMPGECLKAVDAMAISPAVAEPLSVLPWRRVRVAARPSQDALLTLLADDT